MSWVSLVALIQLPNSHYCVKKKKKNTRLGKKKMLCADEITFTFPLHFTPSQQCGQTPPKSREVCFGGKYPLVPQQLFNKSAHCACQPQTKEI